MTTYFPNRWQDLIAYKLLIIRTYRQFSGKAWLNYDKAFREHAAVAKVTDWSSGWFHQWFQMPSKLCICCRQNFLMPNAIQAIYTFATKFQIVSSDRVFPKYPCLRNLRFDMSTRNPISVVPNAIETIYMLLPAFCNIH